MNDLMVDLETFGTGERACIVQIGAVYFDRNTGELGEKFKVNVDANTGGNIDADTVYWWLAQSEEARKSILAEPRVCLFTTLVKFNDFAAQAKRIWSHATFDFVVLQNAYRNARLKPSFTYRTARDIRTLVDLSGVSTDAVPRTGMHHDGLDDAIHQVKYCMVALDKIRKKREFKWE